jgi:hypothetical protein
MISRIDAFLKVQSSLPVTTACLLLILVLAALDHTTGYGLSFSVFYLLPIAFATWYAGTHLVFFSASSARPSGSSLISRQATRFLSKRMVVRMKPANR